MNGLCILKYIVFIDLVYLAPRSGLAWKNSIDVGAGVVDYDYRGNVGVILFNHSDTDFQISIGDRVAQLILERISMATVGKYLAMKSSNKTPLSFHTILSASFRGSRRPF